LNRETNKQPTAPSRLPADLADVAFLDIDDVCAATRMSASWIHAEVRASRFPQPMRFGPRCARWRSADVRDWLVLRAQAAQADLETAALLKARAKRASDAARAKRSAAAAGGAPQ
jgi:predicted DNA-binding transcriptional regulator AlpA